MNLVLGNKEVLDYLVARQGLTHGGVVPIAALLLRGNMSSGRCAVGLHVQIEGKDHFVKCSVDMLQTVGEAMRAAAETLYGEARLP